MEVLKLENQLCFPFYTVSRLIVRKYKPLLDQLGITYPQYLVLLVLWESDHQPVNDIAKKLYLQTNTITPLLQRLEILGIVERSKTQTDERKVLISLSEKGQAMKLDAAEIPIKLMEGVKMQNEELIRLRDQLNEMISILQ
jgi:MarR family transcriptional regulator, organic hydroperoxide resistance regulator